MSNESRLLHFLAATRNSNGNLQRKTIAKCVRQDKCGTLGAVRHSEEFEPALVHRAKTEEKDFIDKMGVYTSFRDLMPRKKGAVLFAPDGLQSTRGPMMLFSYAPGGSLKNSVVVAVTSTSTFQRRLIWHWSKL